MTSTFQSSIGQGMAPSPRCRRRRGWLRRGHDLGEALDVVDRPGRRLGELAEDGLDVRDWP